MSLLQSNPLFNSLITFSKNGMNVASYAQIRAAITKRYQEIYGDDIDISTSTADGQFIEMLCLIINNALQSIKTVYGNLSINNAQGKFLDILAALTNVVRKKGSRSTASITVTLLSASSITVGPLSLGTTYSELQFVDKSGTTWTYAPSNIETFTQNTSRTIIVECDTEGPIRADVGWIDSLVDASILMSVNQTTAAEIGNYDETDSQLRARCLQSLGASGLTVLQSLVGSLRSIDGIDDVKIYNNDTNDSANILAKDGTVIGAHSVYVVLRQKSNASIADSTIGSTIYEKMTPGVCFQKALKNSGGDDDDDPTYPAKNGTGHNYQYVQLYQGIPVGITQIARWKTATAIHPTITVKVKKLPAYVDSQVTASVFDSTSSQKIAAAVMEYMNNLQLSADVSEVNIAMQAQLADSLYRGLSTFQVLSAAVTGSVSGVFANEDTFFNYTTYLAQDHAPDEVWITIN